MRLATWNCFRGSFESKLQAAASLEADVLVLTECVRPATEGPGHVWFGSTETPFGVAVVTRGEYNLQPLPVSAVAPAFLAPVRISGPRSFTLLAVWTISEYKYIRGLNKGLSAFEHVLQNEDAVVAGDFNSNGKWDKLHPKGLNHSALLEKMMGAGLESAYHAHFGERHGEETRATFYHHFKPERDFHIDYCFVPEKWRCLIERVTVGSFEDWRQFSDHSPLVVDIADA